MINLGTVRPGSTIYIPFATYDSNDPSASVTLTGLAVTDIEVYKDGSVTQRASDNGYTLLDTDGIDFDGVTGIHGFSINLADNSTAGFWASGSRYFVVVSSVTVDAATVNFIAATFDIGYPDALLNTTIASLSSQTSFTLTSGPAEDDALNGCVVIIHDVASAVQLGYAVVSDYTGSTKTVTLVAGTTFTAAASDNIAIFPPISLSHIAGAAVSTSSAQLGVNVVNAGGTAWGSGAITAASIASDAITAAKIATGAIDADAIADNAIDAGAIATGAITAAKFAAGAIDAAAIANGAIGASELAADAATEIGTAVWATAARTLTAATNITSTGGTTVPQTGDSYARLGAPAGASVSADVAAVKTDTGNILTKLLKYVQLIVRKDSAIATDNATELTAINANGGSGAGSFDNTTDSEQAIRDNMTTPPTAAAIADQVWEEALTDHSGTSGSTAEALNAAGSAGDPWNTALPGAYASGKAGYILGTNLDATVSSRASQTSVDTIDDFVDTEVAAIKAKTDNLPSDPADASDIAASFSTVNSKLDAIDDYVDTEIAAIKAKTDNLPSDPADASDIAASFSTVNSTLSTIAGYIDTEVAAIKAKTDNLPASPAATSDIPSAATIADAVWDEALSGHTTAGSGGKALSDIDTHTDTEVASILAAVDTEVAAIKAKTDQLTFTTANQVDATTMSMAANALTAAATASDFGTEVATAVWASATRTLSALGFTLSASDLAADTIGASELASDAITEIVNAVLTTAMTESYNADGAAPTLAQAMFVTMQRLTEFAISGTTVTVKKLDGSTTAYTLTLDDATDPTSTTRAT